MKMSVYQESIHQSRYARWLEDKGRRETWEETVTRYFDFFESHLKENKNFDLSPYRQELERAVVRMDIMPSMRALMTAGEALKRENIAGYNCAFISIDHPVAFAELLYVLMNGTGMGYSVQRRDIEQLPAVPDELYETETVIKVRDSKMGWAIAVKELIGMLYAGQTPTWDLSNVRAAGEPLKTFGGRASGPAPLDDAMNFITNKFVGAKGRKLTSVECHDICCKIGEIVVVGGVRRSALISLFDKDDRDMRKAKSGAWWEKDGHRALANNSAMYYDKPSVSSFLSDWKDMIDSHAGEPGIHNVYATRRHIEKQCPNRDPELPIGANPCHEIALRKAQFCNLTMVTVRPNDKPSAIKKKIELATILGTIQASLTNFKFLRKIWQNTTEEEALLGVTLTGVQDNPYTNIHAMDNYHNMSKMLESWKEHAVTVNEDWANKIGIQPSASVTALKPSGNSGALVGASSGIHAAYAPYYIRRVRQAMDDPLTKFMIDKGFPFEVAEREKNTVVFEFPMRSAETAVTENEFDSVKAIDYYLMWQRHYTTHMPSCTVHVQEDEWFDVGAKVYKHFDEIMGISFLPRDDNVYVQAPFERCTEKEYEDLNQKMPTNVDWKELSSYEQSDMTTGSQELACVSGSCEI
jgi:ribonucleoside-diphosphate reductase alpha chain